MVMQLSRAVIISVYVSVSGSYQTILRNIRYLVSGILSYPISVIEKMILHLLEWSNTSIPVCCSIRVIVGKLILQ